MIGFLVMLAVAMPWLRADVDAPRQRVAAEFFRWRQLERFADRFRFNDPRPWWFTGWCRGLCLDATRVVGSDRCSFHPGRRAVTTIDLRLVMWTLLPLVFYSLSIGKQPRYVLPVLPPLALLLASSVVERTQEWRGLDGVRSRPRRVLLVVLGSLASGLFFVVLGVLLYRAQPLLINVAAIYTTIAASAIAIMGALVILTALSPNWRSAPVVIALAALVTLPAVQFGALSNGGDDTVRQMARLVQANRTATEPVGTMGCRRTRFYSGIMTLMSTTIKARSSRRPDRAVDGGAPRPGSQERERAEVALAELRFFTSGVRVRTLLRTDPARTAASRAGVDK